MRRDDWREGSRDMPGDYESSAEHVQDDSHPDPDETEEGEKHKEPPGKKGGPK